MCTYVCIYQYTRAYVSMYIRARVDLCIINDKHIQAHRCMYVYMFILIHAHLYICTQVYMYICTCICAYVSMLSQSHKCIYKFWNADWLEDPEATGGEEGIPRIAGIGLVG